VVAHSLLGQVQLRRDVGVPQALVGQVEHLHLAVGEPTDVRPGARPAEASQLAHGSFGSLRDAAGRPLAP
jgi:hypothetical protein